ncbi:M28 family peptidase [Aliifodinibius sp. S!AR15-10]|uniref:M28 family peptidase n=1 Tax=Aliifodinibius sp. S!AR15-10 TaxID=2950437 RepID=UPI0028605F10|nr:M28 family peptidase [Aliifodinibius sp. S!AR15-10]MDR8392578.1 M28 family peptidase [Aliifodinibius sp. S!AR15-10]
MMNRLLTYFGLILLCGPAVLTGCADTNSTERLNFEKQGREVPSFNADSAYHYIQQQVDFGPRYPGSKGHKLTKAYLIGKLAETAGERNVFAQHFTHQGYEGDTLNLTNIIAAFNPTASDRIMLCAHWDTRPRADEDPNEPNKPILGADDGGSGVGVLLELARMLEENPPSIGVDIVLFDGEDYGKKGQMDRYFLGSRYWANNPPVQNYSPRFGILLDMVGGENAQFPKELNSLRFAPALVNEIWQIADGKGYSDTFINREGVAISDDHVVINRILRIPTIDIIRHEPGTGSTVKFAPYWHTHKDNMEIISRETLDSVGEVLAELIYNRI